MHRGIHAATAASLLALHAAVLAAPAAADAAPAPQAAPVAADAVAAARRPEPPVRAVVAPPRPVVETVVRPGLERIEKHERLTDVLKARKRAGRSDRVVAD